MANRLELDRAWFDSSMFHDQFRNALQKHSGCKSGLRVLDYGAGKASLLFMRLAPDQMPVVAYDPHVDFSDPIFNTEYYKSTHGINSLSFAAGEFDLAICHFSLHHMTTPITEALQTIRDTSGSPTIAIAEYDYTKATQEEFATSFANQQEKRELNQVFQGDIEACFNFHRRAGISDYEGALQKAGYNISHRGKGEEFAANKFFLIAEAGK